MDKILLAAAAVVLGFAYPVLGVIVIGAAVAIAVALAATR